MSKIFTIETMQGHSDSFYRYITKLGQVNSRQEEDELVTKDLQKLKQIYSNNSGNPDQAKEYVVRIMYAEMLGHPAEFGYIHCVNLSSTSRLSFKRTGYLATWLCISPDNELMYLTVANIQKDLRSPNFLEVAAALDGAARFLRPELILAVVNDVTGLLSHNKITVRRKAVEALHAFYNHTDGEVADRQAFRQALCDRDPSVMGAAVRLLFDVVRRHPRSQYDLLDSFLSILTQVTERRLPRSYDYHRTPAPWLQMALLRLITMLVGNDASLAQKCETTLRETMLRADNGLLIGFAIICEVVRTAATIPKLPGLITLCCEAVARFVTSSSANLRLAGIQALTQLARVDPGLASSHQAQVMACLEDTDDTIRRRTLVLLFAICTADNVEPIVARFLQFLRKTTDVFVRQHTATAISLAAERYAPSAEWFILTMNKLLATASECVPPSAPQRMLKLIAEGQGAESNDVEFRAHCVEEYFNLMGARGLASGSGATGGAAGGASSSSSPSGAALPRGFNAHEAAAAAHSERLMRVAAWVMGEYGFLSKRVSRAMLLDRLCDMMDRTEETETRSWVVTAMMKLVAHHPEECPENVEEVIARFQDSRSTNLQQRCNEFLALLKVPGTMRKVLPLDGCCEDIHVDAGMASLNSIVRQALEKGARPYDVKSAQRYRIFHETSTARTGAALRIEAYAPANKWSAAAVGGGGAGDALGSDLGLGPSPVTLAAASAGGDATAWEDELRLQSAGTTRRWGVQNLSADATAPVVAPPQGAAVEAAELALPTTLNRWSTTAPNASQGDVAWQLQGTGVDAGSSGSASSPSPQQQQPHSAKTERFVSAIFGNGRSKRRKAPSAAATTTAAATMMTPSSATQRPTAVENASRGRASAALDELFGDNHITPPPSVQQRGYRTGAAPASSAIDALFGSSDSPHSPPVIPTAGTSGSLSLFARRAADGAARTTYVVSLQVAGTTAAVARVPRVAVEMTLPAGCTVTDPLCKGHSQVHLEATAAPAAGATTGSVSLVLTDCPTNTSLEVSVTLSVANAASFLRALSESRAQKKPLMTTLTCAAERHVGSVQLPFVVSHVLRPAPPSFQTALFGEEWANASCEAQGQLRSAQMLSPASVQISIAPRASLRVVEVIGSEVIAAAELATPTRASNTQPLYVLCHFQVHDNGSGASFLVHTRHDALSAAVCEALSQQQV